jgi:hypothetical protein
MINARAVRYRRLALAADDRAKADLLLKLADECDRGVQSYVHRRNPEAARCERAKVMRQSRRR